MIFGFSVDSDNERVDALIDEWNEVFKEPTRQIISETEYKKKNNVYIMSIKSMFPYFIWFAVFGLGAISSFVFGFYTAGAILTGILLLISLFFMPYVYFIGTKSRLRRRGFKGKIKYLSASETLKNILGGDNEQKY